MVEQVKFIVYSDIHYDRLGAKCVTIDDCEGVERAVYKRFEENNPDEKHFNFSVFCGDRFLKREPEDEVKTKADVVLIESMYERIHYKRPHFHLIGNHDWITRSKQWHTSRFFADYLSESNYVWVLSEPKTIKYHMGTNDCPVDLRIHALPAGFEMDISVYDIDPKALNLFIFHDMVTGCKLDDEGKVLAESGISLASIDRPEFDLVLSGDIHVPQRLPFKNTRGGYVGAVLQRTRADANCDRGWMEVTATREASGKWDFDIDFVPVRGFFTKFSFQVDANSKYEGLRLDENRIADTHCEVELIGSRADVDRIANDPRWENYNTYYNVRNLMLTRKYKVEKQEAVVDMSESHGVMDDLNMYLDSGFVDIGNLPREGIVGVVNSVLEDK